MKIKTPQFKQVLIAALTLSMASFSCQSADLQISIDQINSDNGLIMAQLFSGEENYKKGQAEQSLTMSAKKGPGKLTFSGLAAGEYVVRMFHDENNNQSMDSNAFGMPIEGYGFSNEAVGHMGPPQYKDMVVMVSDEDAVKDAVVITKTRMIY